MDTPRRKVRVRLVEPFRIQGDEAVLPNVAQEAIEHMRSCEASLESATDEDSAQSSEKHERGDQSTSADDLALAQQIESRTHPVLEEIVQGAEQAMEGLASAQDGAERCVEAVNREAYIASQKLLADAMESIIHIKSKGEDWMPTRRGWVSIIIEVVLGSVIGK